MPEAEVRKCVVRCPSRRIRAPLENGPRHPRTEFFVANALLFTERLFATGGRDEFFEDFQTDGFDTRLPELFPH